MMQFEVTRGFGLLEGLLAKQRSKMADKLIPLSYREGRILDIGCGVYPWFLSNTNFSEKYGLDKTIQANQDQLSWKHNFNLTKFDIEIEDTFPFPNGFFEIVTMLAVFEHIEPAKLVKILSEIHRVLKPKGFYILTTPAVWTDRILRIMAKLRLVSPVEIQEHKDAYSRARIASILQQANFSKGNLKSGYFEMFMNIWVIAAK